MMQEHILLVSESPDLYLNKYINPQKLSESNISYN